MRSKVTLSALLLFLAINTNAQQAQDFEEKKEQVSRPKQSKGRKSSKPAVPKNDKAGKGRSFIPLDEVSPDIPVSFPADI